MQELTKAIERAHKGMMSGTLAEDDQLTGEPGEMLEAAQKWSHTALLCFSGELLRKAMLLAAAMSEFAHEAQNPS